MNTMETSRNLYLVKALGSECPCAKKHREMPSRIRWLQVQLVPSSHLGKSQFVYIKQGKLNNDKTTCYHSTTTSYY